MRCDSARLVFRKNCVCLQRNHWGLASGHNSCFIFGSSWVQTPTRRPVPGLTCGFPQYLQGNTRANLKLGHELFLSYPLHFSIHPIIRRCIPSRR
jgi:hypothetical protein